MVVEGPTASPRRPPAEAQITAQPRSGLRGGTPKVVTHCPALASLTSAAAGGAPAPRGPITPNLPLVRTTVPPGFGRARGEFPRRSWIDRKAGNQKKKPRRQFLPVSAFYKSYIPRLFRQ